MNMHLLSSKTRVAPLKPLTIPGKELLSALLTARLINSVKSALEHFINIKSVNCWLDSSVALHWIKNNQNEYKQFIENRRQEILKLVELASFNYCPTGKIQPILHPGVTTFQAEAEFSLVTRAKIPNSAS